METLKSFFANLQSKPLYLNHSRTKSIQICLDPVSLPDIKPVYRLNSHDHNCSLIFSKETMTEISKHSSSIENNLRSMTEKKILLNNEIKVFSEIMHGRCAICFLSIRGIRINMMDISFSKMMKSSDKLSVMHQRLESKVNENAKMLKQLMDSVLAKYTQCNGNNNEFKCFLQQLNHNAQLLCGQVNAAVQNDDNQVVVLSDTSNEEDEDEDDYGDEDDYYGRRRRRRRDWYDDEDDEEDDYDEDNMDY